MTVKVMRVAWSSDPPPFSFCVKDGSPQGGDGFGSVHDSLAPKADAKYHRHHSGTVSKNTISTKAPIASGPSAAP
jgi:hypothetical protein